MMMRNGRPAVSLIVPVHRERGMVPNLMATLEPFVGMHEIVIVDGGSEDGTFEELVARTSAQMRVLRTSCGRACQMNAGARAASGRVLLFLHADTTIDHEGPELALAATDRGADAGCFEVRIDSRHRRLTAAGWLQSIRSRVMTSATGDQCLFVRSDVFRELGGFSEDHPICEDIDFVKRFAAVRGGDRFVCLRPPVRTSGRRWEQGGINRTIALMWGLRLAYHLGAPPDRLARFYQTVR
jgi:rSAM/selenodomain-associated transferase 2